MSFLFNFALYFIAEFVKIQWWHSIKNYQYIRTGLLAGLINFMYFLGMWQIYVDRDLWAGIGMVVGVAFGSGISCFFSKNFQKEL